MKLHPNWRYAPKYISNRCIAIVVAINTGYHYLDSGLQNYLPESVMRYISLALLLTGSIGTIIQQDVKKDDANVGDSKHD